MATVGQIVTEFIVRGEAYFHKNVPNLLEALDDGEDDALTKLYECQDLFMFLVELQGLYHDWSDRDILIMIDYFDSTYNLKALQSAIPDPYKSYENAAVVIGSETVLLEVPAGNGILEQKNGALVLYDNETEINSDYGLE